MNQLKHTDKPEKVKNPPSRPVFFQPKLTVNQPNDVYEQEADSMADRVMRMSGASAPQAFFKPANNDIQRKCQHCEEEEGKVHRKENSGAETQGSNALDNYVGSLGSSGQALSATDRQFFEPKFGHDFSGVKVHTDTVAAKSAQSINALAYTTGNNIVFNSGQYSPESDSGKKLLAHELTHVVQQSSTIQPKTIQRAPGDPVVTNWWDADGIGTKPEQKFTDDMTLFFPKDIRKFTGQSKGNVASIDCDANNAITIGKAYWEEADGQKRKALLTPLIEKADENRYTAAIIDNEDLTNDKIVSKLKALSKTDLKNYLKQLGDKAATVKNDQVIAYLKGNDKSKGQILKTANEALLDWKFDNNRLSDADLKDEKTNTRLRGLTNADKLDKETKEKDLSAKTGEDTTKLQSFLHTQTTTSTPLSDNAVVDSAGGFTLSFPNVDIIVLPDTSGGSQDVTSIAGNLPKTYAYHTDAKGLMITDFYNGDDKNPLPIDFPDKVTITIQTTFEKMSNADQESVYGRGTTAQDIKWGGKTLRFHEGSHGKGAIDYIRSHPFPSLAIGTVKPADIIKTLKILNDINVDSCKMVDQVGNKQNDFLKTPDGIASGIVSCGK